LRFRWFVAWVFLFPFLSPFLGLSLCLSFCHLSRFQIHSRCHCRFLNPFWLFFSLLLLVLLSFEVHLYFFPLRSPIHYLNLMLSQPQLQILQNQIHPFSSRTFSFLLLLFSSFLHPSFSFPLAFSFFHPSCQSLSFLHHSFLLWGPPSYFSFLPFLFFNLASNWSSFSSFSFFVAFSALFFLIVTQQKQKLKDFVNERKQTKKRK